MNNQCLSLKEHVQLWIDENKIPDCFPIGLGKGCRGVRLYVNNLNLNEFISLYPSLETKFYKGYFTKEKYGCSIYISMVKKK